MNSVEVEQELALIYQADQDERTVGWNNIDFEQLKENDKPRLKRAKEIFELIKANKVILSGQSLYQLGILFQHSKDINDYPIAGEIGKLSGDAGYSDGYWLSAAAEDRYLVHTTQKQKWGTQFQKNDEEWELVPMIDDAESGATDDLREKRSIPPKSRQLDVFLARADI